MYAVWKHYDNIYSISEKCSGGELNGLFDPNPYQTKIRLDYPIRTNSDCNVDPWSSNFRLIFCLIIYVKILKTLQCLHKKGIIHQDIKPENVMLKEEPQLEEWGMDDLGSWKKYTDIRLIDFGISCVDGEMGDGKSCEDKEVGTPGYKSPLMFDEKKTHTELCDVWSSTILFYAMYLGDPYEYCKTKNYSPLSSKCNDQRAEYLLDPFGIESLFPNKFQEKFKKSKEKVKSVR